MTRTVLVTGANRGIGREVARQLVAGGDHVAVTARDLVAAERTATELGPGAVGIQLDVTDQASVDAAARVVEDRFGRLDVIVNNAAIHYDTWQRAASADLDVVRDAIDTNLLGAWRVILALLDLLRRGAHGRIVNVSSQGGSLATMGAGTPAYHVSKAGLNALTRTLAAELESDGILVNAVCPGWVATDMGGSGGRPVREGAAGIVWAATLPDNGPTGGFFRDTNPIPW